MSKESKRFDEMKDDRQAMIDFVEGEVGCYSALWYGWPDEDLAKLFQFVWLYSSARKTAEALVKDLKESALIHYQALGGPATTTIVRFSPSGRDRFSVEYSDGNLANIGVSGRSVWFRMIHG